MSAELKVLLGVLLFGAWAIFVANGLAPVTDFVTFIRDALIGLGIFGAALTNPKGKGAHPPEIHPDQPPTQN